MDQIRVSIFWNRFVFLGLPVPYVVILSELFEIVPPAFSLVMKCPFGSWNAVLLLIIGNPGPLSELNSSQSANVEPSVNFSRSSSIDSQRLQTASDSNGSSHVQFPVGQCSWSCCCT